MLAKQSYRLFPVISLWLVLSFITGCSGGVTSPTAMPTSAPTATPAPKPLPTVMLNLSSGSPQVPVGQPVAILLRVEPYEKLDWRWDISGTSGGQLNKKMGEDVVYTAGNRPGLDIVVAEAQTPGGAIVTQKVALNVVAAPATTVSTQPTAPVLTTAPPQLPPTATPSASNVILTSLAEGQSVPCENLVKGTYTPDIKDHIWPVVFIGNRFHPQDDGGKAPPMFSGNWYATVRFGDCNQPPAYDKGKLFQLIIVTANESANAEFERYIKQGPSVNWPGLPELPAGAKVYVRIAVIRQ